MYRGYILDYDWNQFNDDEGKKLFDQCYEAGKIIYDRKKVQVKSTLESFISKDGSLDGTKMQNNWFPQIKSDVFISHSHKDEKKAIFLAGLLSKAFRLELFIDSCIWGNANDLLKIIDNEYCYNSDSKTYMYEKRNYSTSHIHMILSTALTMMIDKTECLFFLKTSNSITASSLINKTLSPWIYNEIAISQMIRKRNPKEHRILKKSFSATDSLYNESLQVEYELPTNHLTDINDEVLNNWFDFKEKNNIPTMDALYKIT